MRKACHVKEHFESLLCLSSIAPSTIELQLQTIPHPFDTWVFTTVHVGIAGWLGVSTCIYLYSEQADRHALGLYEDEEGQPLVPEQVSHSVLGGARGQEVKQQSEDLLLEGGVSRAHEERHHRLQLLPMDVLPYILLYVCTGGGGGRQLHTHTHTYTLLNDTLLTTHK